MVLQKSINKNNIKKGVDFIMDDLLLPDIDIDSMTDLEKEILYDEMIEELDDF